MLTPDREFGDLLFPSKGGSGYILLFTGACPILIFSSYWEKIFDNAIQTFEEKPDKIISKGVDLWKNYLILQ